MAKNFSVDTGRVGRPQVARRDGPWEVSLMQAVQFWLSLLLNHEALESQGNKDPVTPTTRFSPKLLGSGLLLLTNES